VIDTGFTGMLAVSDEVVAHLGMRRWSSAAYYGADGKVHGIATYLGELKWISEWSPVEVSESGVQEVLIGAGLLKGLALSIDYGIAQSVEIR
jgi:clan AA aspartic protease